jgi:cysteinyl-tRNA synthetase
VLGFVVIRRARLAAPLAVALGASCLASCSAKPDEPRPRPEPPPSAISAVAYQLQNYPNGSLDEIAAGNYQLAIVDLARDARGSYFTADEIAKLRASGKKVLAYFEIGSLEWFRPEADEFRGRDGDLVLNEWPEWPGEFFVKYWEPRWWDLVVRPRLDRALAAGFDGVYLDTPLAYEEIRTELVPGEDRDDLGAKMAGLVERISSYVRRARPGFQVVPQNSPELRHYPGYTEAIDGIGMEELFFEATDLPCTADYCAENLDNARALHAAGKLVVAIDYASEPENIAEACRRYREEGFAGSVTVRALDRLTPACP